MKILIIGGTGLISTSLTRQLLERGEDVTLYNRGQSITRLEGGFTHITGDRTNYREFEEQIRHLSAFDRVIDMVCYDPHEAMSAVQAFDGYTKQYIFCSTVDVYTKYPVTYPITEKVEHKPLGQYAEKKAQCEEIFQNAFQTRAFPVTIIRPAQTYGEGGPLIHSLGWSTTYIDRIRKGKPIIVHGDGMSLWSSCHIDDVARAFIGAIDNDKTIGNSYHVTGEEWRTWNRYHREVALALEAPEPQFIHIPSDLLARIAPKRADVCAINFQFNNIFDNTAARQDLGFRYTIPWIEGVRRTVNWLEEQKRIDNSDNDSTDDQIIAAWKNLSNQMVQDLADLNA